MINRKPDHDPHDNRDLNPDNDNSEDQAIVAAPAAGARTARAARQTALNAVDTGAASGRSGLPMLMFKREGGGVWSYGQQRIVVEDGSSWAVNPLTFKRGYIAFSNDNKVAGERLVPVSQPMPDITELPDVGFTWTEQWSVCAKCTDGTDAGLEVIYKPTTTGGVSAVASLIDAVRDRLNSGRHDGKVSPIVRLEKSSYQHGQYGKVWTPLLPIVDWMSLDGPAPAPAPEPPPPPAAQPRRRRVG